VKKRYSKPDIAFESFSLSTSIAGNCEFKTDSHSDGECGFYMDAVGVVFVIGVDACQVPITDELSLKYNGFCYHVPIGSSNLFNS
jgi:hypothetical protein